MCAPMPTSTSPSRTPSTARSSTRARAAAASSASTWHESVYDRFVDGFVALARQYVLDDPLDEKTTLGPMAQTRFAEAVRKQTAEAVAKGARALIDTKAYKRAKAGTPWLEPQVLTGVDHTMSVMTEESFGPVVGIMKVRDDDEAISLMNDSRYGLTASVWTQDLDAAERIGARIADRHRLRQPLRLSRPRPRLDRRQGHGPRRLSVAHRLRDADAAQELPPERGTGS